MVPFLFMMCLCIAQAESKPVWIGAHSSLRFELPSENLLDNTPGKVSELSDRSLTVLSIERIEPGKDAVTAMLIRFVALQSGRYDLREYLPFKTPSARAQLPLLEIQVLDPLPTDHQGQFETPSVLTRSFSGDTYSRWLAYGAISLWLLGLIAVCLARWAYLWPSTSMVPSSGKEDDLPRRLRLAEAHSLSPQGLAEIQRALLERWRHELKMTDLQGLEFMAALQQHPRGQALLDALETWLRQVEKSATPLPALLEPYATSTQAPAEMQQHDV